MALAVVTLSLAGHAAAGGTLPSVLGFAVAVVLAGGLSMLVRAGMSAARMLVLLLGAQALLHTIFIISSDCAMPSGHVMGLVPSTSMILGHVVASVLAVAVLRHGDEVLTAWTALLTAAFGAPALALPSIPGPRTASVPAWDAHEFGADAPLLDIARRGPPPA